MHGEAARPVRRRTFLKTSDPVQRERIRVEATAHVDHLLELVARRRAELAILERELLERRDRAQAAETAS